MEFLQSFLELLHRTQTNTTISNQQPTPTPTTLFTNPFFKTWPLTLLARFDLRIDLRIDVRFDVRLLLVDLILTCWFDIDLLSKYPSPNRDASVHSIKGRVQRLHSSFFSHWTIYSFIEPYTFEFHLCINHWVCCLSRPVHILIKSRVNQSAIEMNAISWSWSKPSHSHWTPALHFWVSFWSIHGTMVTTW